MKRLDRLVLGELIGPWAFGVAIFTVLIMAGSFLFQLTKYLSLGVSPLQTFQLLALLMPGVMAKTFSMAMLLAALLAFGRLSGDSEVVAIKAGGISVGRVMAPVAVMGFLVFLLAFGFSNYLVPSASYKALVLRSQIDKTVKDRTEHSTYRPIYDGGYLQALLVARDFDLTNRTLKGAYIISFDKSGNPTFYLEAAELEFTDEKQWRISGGARLIPADGGPSIKILGDAFPDEVPNPDVTPEDLIAQSLNDLDVMSMARMKEQIARERANPQAKASQIANLEFGYWNKIALPLAALVFGLVGAPLGIRNHRTGTATGFWLSVIIIFGYMLLSNVMSILAQGGRLPAWLASFSPIAVGLVVAAILIHRRNI